MLKKPNYNIKNKTVKQIVFDAQNDIIRASQNELAQVGHKLVRYAQNGGLGLSQNKIGKMFFGKTPQNFLHLLKKYPYEGEPKTNH